MSRSDRPPVEETLPISATSAAAPRTGDLELWLSIHSGGDLRVVPLVDARTLRVGRSPEADVVLEDPLTSRVHLHVTRRGGDVWVADAGSVNGSFVDGRRIEGEHLLRPGETVSLGETALALHAHTPPRPAILEGIESHDRFVRALEDELSRARCFHRTSGLLMLRATQDDPSFLSRTCPRVLASLRAADRCALYASDALEIVLLEADEATIEQIAAALLDGRGPDEPGLRCAVAVYPHAGASAGALLEVCRAAVYGAAEPLARPITGSVDPTPGDARDEGPLLLSPAHRSVYAMARQLAGSAMPVLITGETGVGKEVLARAIHEASPRRAERMVSMNCGAIAPQLLESELFGHERGAFTGAHARKSGIFEAADRGTLLLDELGELSLSAQAALLRVLETGQLTRVGGTVPLDVNVRVVAATNRDLEAACASGAFRVDLLYRLNAASLVIPPLRERVEEIVPLAERFLERLRRVEGRPAFDFSPDARDLLVAYPWPGNVRELRNVVHRAAATARGRSISARELGVRLRTTGRRPDATQQFELERPDPPYKERVRAFERKVLTETLEATDWNRSEAARRLQMPLRTLTNRIRALAIEPPER